MLKRKISLFAIGLASMLGTLNLGFVSSASASTCAISNKTNHGVTYFTRTIVYTVKNNLGAKIADRAACMNIIIDGNPNGSYRFLGYVQDTVDTRGEQFSNDDQGYAQIQYTTPGTTVWHSVVYDRNSADFLINESTGGAVWSSQVFYAPTHGHPSGFKWRLKMTTHYKWGLDPSWNWHTKYSTPFSLSQ